MGFASGFNAGWRMAYAADSAKKEEKDAELRRKANELRIAAAEGDLRRQAQLDADERELRDAGRAATVVTGQQLQATGGGRLFFADPNAAAAVADQEQTIAEMTDQKAAAGEQMPALSGRVVGTSTAGRPLIENADGSVSSERTITVEADGRHYLIPTIVEGKLYSPDEAIRLWSTGKNKEVGVFDNAQDAERAARARSANLVAQGSQRPQTRGAQLASAAAVGGRIFADPNAAAAYAQAENTPVARMSRQADALGRQGKVGAETALRDQIAAARKEGVDRVLDVILSGGDEVAARDAYNSIGKDRFGDGDGIRIIKRYQVARPGYEPIDTAEIEVTKNGKTQRIADAFAARHALGDRALDIAKTGYDAKRQQERDASTEDDRKANREFRERELSLREQQARIDAALGAARIRALDREGAANMRGTIDLEEVEKASKYFGKRGEAIFGVGDATNMGGNEQERQEKATKYNDFLLRAEQMFTIARASGQLVTPEEIAQAAAFGKTKQEDLGGGRFRPVIEYKDKLYVVGGPMQSGAPTAANARARGFDEPMPVLTASPQLDAGSRGAQLAAAAAPAPGSVAARAPSNVRTLDAAVASTSPVMLLSPSGGAPVSVTKITQTPEQFQAKLAAIDQQIAGTKAAQQQVARAMAGVTDDKQIALLKGQVDALAVQLARQQAARNALVR